MKSELRRRREDSFSLSRTPPSHHCLICRLDMQLTSLLLQLPRPRAVRLVLLLLLLAVVENSTDHSQWRCSLYPLSLSPSHSILLSNLHSQSVSVCLSVCLLSLSAQFDQFVVYLLVTQIRLRKKLKMFVNECWLIELSCN